MSETTIEKSLGQRLQSSRLVRWGVGIPFVLAVVLFITSFFLDEPLRRNMEENINRNLKGYTVRVPKLHLQLLDLSLTFKDLTVLQQAHPDPPIVAIPVLRASIHWQEILYGKLVAEFRLDRPKISIWLLVTFQDSKIL